MNERKIHTLPLLAKSLFHRVGDLFESATHKRERALKRHLTTFYPHKADEIREIRRPE